jgi:xylan 1,4-beta-xylosidase
MLWHYHDDDLPGPAAQVTLQLEKLAVADGPARLTHFRIDDFHSNAFAVWKRLGSPIAPNEPQYAQLQAAGQLAEMGGGETVRLERGRATVTLTLPRQAVSLLVLEWD